MSRSSLAVVELSLRLPAGRLCAPPDVRFWVDLEPGTGLRGEVEVALLLQRPWVFRGSFVVEPEAHGAFFYRLGLCAMPRSVWTLRIRDAAKGADLLSDGDTLDTAKSWLVGTCPVGDAAKGADGAALRSEVVSLDDVRARRAARARLGRTPR